MEEIFLVESQDSGYVLYWGQILRKSLLRVKWSWKQKTTKFETLKLWSSWSLICAWFLRNQVWKIKLEELDFLSVSNWNFTACVTCKIQVLNKQTIKFVQLDFSKIKCRSIEGAQRNLITLAGVWIQNYHLSNNFYTLSNLAMMSLILDLHGWMRKKECPPPTPNPPTHCTIRALKSIDFFQLASVVVIVNSCGFESAHLLSFKHHPAKIA